MTGELAALGAAFLWAVASIIFADIGLHIRAINLNLIKGLIACSFMIVILFLGSLLGAAELRLGSLFSISSKEFLLLVTSGAIGIGIGDTAYFACLKRIGPQKGLMLESVAPVIAALLAILLFHEYLPLYAWYGILLTTLGVILVVRLSHSQMQYSNSIVGITFGLVAASAQAAGVVLSRMVLAGGEVDPLASSFLRLAAGLLILALWVQVRKGFSRNDSSHQPLRQAMTIIARHHLAGKMFIAMFIGTFCAIWLQQISLRHTSAGITQTLLAACPLFGMLIGVYQGQKQPVAVWAGLLLGLTGISLLFLG